MRMTNLEAEARADALKPLLDRCDAIGYAAARNARVLTQESLDYLQKKNELVRKHGTEEKDAEGNPTGRWQLVFGSEGFADYCREIEAFATAEIDPPVYTVPISAAKGELTGSQIMSVWWMFTDEEGKDGRYPDSR